MDSIYSTKYFLIGEIGIQGGVTSQHTKLILVEGSLAFIVSFTPGVLAFTAPGTACVSHVTGVLMMDASCVSIRAPIVQRPGARHFVVIGERNVEVGFSAVHGVGAGGGVL